MINYNRNLIMIEPIEYFKKNVTNNKINYRINNIDILLNINNLIYEIL
jgi:hypothetical protein